MDEVPDPLKISIIQAILGGSDLPEVLMAADKSRFSFAVDKYLAYGESSFYYKLPTASVSHGEVNSANLLAVIQGIAGQPVIVAREEFDIADSGEGYAYRAEYLHIADIKDLDTRRATAEAVVPVVTAGVGGLRTDILAVVFTTDTTTTLALYESLLASAEAAGTISTADHIKIYDDILASPTVVDQPTTDDANLVGYASVAVNNNIDEVTEANRLVQEEAVPFNEFYYEVADGTYPILNNTLDLTDRYLPVVPIKQNKRYIGTNSAAYKTGNKLLGTVGLGAQDFKDALDSSSIPRKDVVAAFFAFTVDMKTKDPASLKYLFRLWEKEAISNSIHNTVSSTPTSEYAKGYYRSVPPRSKLIRVVESTYESSLSYLGIQSYKTNNRVVGTVGTVTSRIVRQSPGSFSPRGHWSNVGRIPFERNYIIYEKQVTPRSTVSVLVYGIHHTTIVRSRRKMTIRATLTNGEDLYLPLNYDLVQELPSRDQSEVLGKSMSLIIYWQHREVVKTGFFGSFFFELVLIVIIVVSLYYGAADFANFVADISAGTITATEAFTIVATNIAISVATSFALSELAKVGGVFAVIAAVYMMYRFNVGGIATTSDGSSMPLAEQLLKSVTLVSNTMAASIGDAAELGYELLAEESERFLMAAEEKREELQEAKDLLGDADNMYNPLLVSQSTDHFVSVESPAAFYNRALNTNPGVAALSYISSYASISVSLPEWNGLYQEEVTPDSL